MGDIYIVHMILLKVINSIRKIEIMIFLTYKSTQLSN